MGETVSVEAQECVREMNLNGSVEEADITVFSVPDDDSKVGIEFETKDGAGTLVLPKATLKPIVNEPIEDDPLREAVLE